VSVQRYTRQRRFLTALLMLGVCSMVAACGGASPNTSTTSATTEPPPTKRFGVSISVHAGPTCPVERPDEPCPDVPVRGTVQVRLAGATDGEVQVSGPTDTAGNYRAELPAGSYVVTVDTGAPLPRCEAQTFTVLDRDVEVDIPCDSGIR